MSVDTLDPVGPYEDDGLPYMNFECPGCGFPLCEWTDCPECGWYDEAVWDATMADYQDCRVCRQTTAGRYCEAHGPVATDGGQQERGAASESEAEREATWFWEKYEIPFEFGAAIKVRSSGLKRGSWGDGRARDTVVHLHVKESFKDGRLSRSADSYLCEKGSHIDLQGEEPPVSDGLPKKITCETCLNRMERWKLSPEERIKQNQSAEPEEDQDDRDDVATDGGTDELVYSKGRATERLAEYSTNTMYYCEFCEGVFGSVSIFHDHRLASDNERVRAADDFERMQELDPGDELPAGATVAAIEPCEPRGETA